MLRFSKRWQRKIIWYWVNRFIYEFIFL